MRCDMAAAYVDGRISLYVLEERRKRPSASNSWYRQRGFFGAKTDLDAAPFAGTTVSDDLAELI